MPSATKDPLFSVSQFTTWNLTFEQDIALYSRLGITGIEICERKLSRDLPTAARQLQLLKDAGLRPTSIQPRVHALFRDSMNPELEDPEIRAAEYRKTIEIFAGAFPEESPPLVAISGGAPGYNFREAHRTARRLYRELAEYAADLNIRIMFEPLSPVLMNVDTFICNLTDAMEFIADVDRPNFGLMLDVWHVWREPDICRRLLPLGKQIFGVHICDWPENEPRHFADRVLPGDGVIDLPALLGAIDASGYSGAYCLEIFSLDQFSDSLWNQPPEAILNRGRLGFTKAWATRHAPRP
jgi:sugar phosphate isomerase/epimerase